MASLNVQIMSYLQSQKITPAPGDYATVQVEGQPETIKTWNTANLGAQPTSDQLIAAWNAAQFAGQQIAKAVSVDDLLYTKIANVTFNGVVYQIDDSSLVRVTAMGADAKFSVLAGAVAGNLRWADPNTDFGWIALDNTIHTMDAQTMSAFAETAKSWVLRNTLYARALKTSILNTADATALAAIDITTGWPT